MTTIRQRLAAKGEPVLAEPGGEVVLETADPAAGGPGGRYGIRRGALPENSFFERLVLELAVWQK